MRNFVHTMRSVKDSDDYWVSSVVAAAMLGLSRSQINRLAANGELEAEKLSGYAWMFRASVIEAFAKSRQG